MIRCTNCYIRLQRCRRYLVNRLEFPLRILLAAWVDLPQFPQDATICHKCYLLLDRQCTFSNHNAKRALGHKRVCPGCGLLERSAARGMEFHILEATDPLVHTILAWDSNVQLTAKLAFVCNPCWMRAKKELSSGVEDLQGTRREVKKEVLDLEQDMLPPLNSKMCRICFVTDCKLYNMAKWKNLDREFNNLTGITLTNDLPVPPYLCTECAQRLLNYAQFRNRSVQAHMLLMEVVSKHGCVTVQSVQSFIGDDFPIGSQLKVSETKHTDINVNVTKPKELDKYINEINDINDVQMVKDSSVNKGYVKVDYYNDKPEEENPFIVETKVATLSISDTVVSATNVKPLKGIQTNENGFNEENYVNIADGMIDIHIKSDNTAGVSSDTTNVGDLNDLTEDSKSTMDTNDSDKVNNETSVKYFTSLIRNDVIKDLVKREAKEEVVDPVTVMDGDTEIKDEPRRYMTRSQYRSFADKLIIDSKNVQCKTAETTRASKIVKIKRDVKKLPKCPKVPTRIPYKTIKDVVWGNLPNMRRYPSYNCNKCSYTTVAKKDIITHLQGHGLKNNPKFACSTCRNVFTNKYSLERHSVLCTRYTCQICKEHFKFRFHYELHKRVHSDENTFSCEVCQKTFNFKTSLILHTAKAHPYRSEVDLKDFIKTETSLTSYETNETDP